MAGFFEKSTQDGSYKVAAKTRNNFFDGELRIEPPVIFDERRLFVISDMNDTLLEGMLAGKTATLLYFSFPEAEEDADYQAKIEATVDYLLGDLTRLGGAEEFKNTF